MANEQDWTRGDIGSWLGVLLCIILLESHVIARPPVFLVSPFVVLIPSLVLEPVRMLSRLLPLGEIHTNLFG